MAQACLQSILNKALDTHALIRRLTQEDPGQARAAEAQLQGHAPLWISLPVLVETHHVLARLYGWKKDALTLGKWPDMGIDQAIHDALAHWSTIREGKNPSDVKRDARVEGAAKVATVEDLATRYIEEHLPGNGEIWQKETKRLLAKHILPAIGKLALKDIGPGEISAMLQKLSKTPTQARLVRAVSRSMFGRAEEWGLRPVGSNPVAVVKQRNSEGSVKRDRRLSDLELKALGEAMRTSKETPEFLLAIRLAVMAGMRKGEIEGARWAWYDAKKATITIPKEFHKTGRKTNKARVVRLCSGLVAELNALTKTLDCPFIIPGRPKEKDGKVTWGPLTALQNPWERIRVAAKLAVKGEPKEEDPGLHDLRRTFASVGVRPWTQGVRRGVAWPLRTERDRHLHEDG